MRRFIPWFAGVSALCCLAVWAALHHPGVPYNVKEIFGHGGWVRGGLFLAVILTLVLGSPMLAACRLAWPGSGAGGALSAESFSVLWAVQSSLASILVVYGAPAESLHDLVGSPTLGWPDSMELGCRLAGLFGAPLAVLDGAALAAVGGIRRLLRWDVLGTVAFAVVLWYVVVVHGANTDNITELLPNHGRSARLLALFLWALLLGLGMSLPASLADGRARILPLVFFVVVAASVPVGWGLAVLGTEGHVVKYGRTFSALQFLLSADRERLASGMPLFMRYAVVHGGILAMGVLCQSSVVVACRGLFRRGSPRPGRDRYRGAH
ncbi:MAG: VanZ family protein [Desulfacinum sp.]|nr:VanZ family protein [Desulfacinum sp.]